MKWFSSCGSVHDRFPPLSPKYQWFVAQSPQADKDDNGDHFFFNIQDPLSFYQCRIPELCKKRIRGSFHGWFILSDDDNMWSLWDPVTSNIRHLPPLVLTDGGDSTSIKECCLSLPPDDPKSILLLTRSDKTTFVFCLLNRGRKMLKWTEISYSKPLTRISGDGCFIHSLCCCNGKVYALNTDNTFYGFIIEIRIVVKDRRAAIKLMLFAARPQLLYSRGYDYLFFLRGSNTELFFITIVFNFHVRRDTSFSLVSLHKLGMTSLNCAKLEGLLKKWDITGKKPGELDEEEVDNMCDSVKIWEQIKDLKDGSFFVDLARDNSVVYSPTIASEFGGNIHIRSRMGKVIYSYNISERTILVSSMFPSRLLPTNHVSVWDCRLAADYAKGKQEVEDKDRRIAVRLVNDDDDVELDESRLLNLPLHVLEMIMEFCIGLEYLNFRATCKVCHLAAPVVQWSGEVALKRLQNYSFLSPWLMMADKKRGIVTFEDPLYGYKFFMKNLRAPIPDGEVCYSGYGWLLYYSQGGLKFCNPFTDEVHDLPETERYFFYSLCFSAPPTSPDCMVVGFDTQDIYIHFVHGEQTWRLVGSLGDDEDGDDDFAFYYPTFYGRDLYALCLDGKLHVFKNLGQEDYSWKKDVVEIPNICGDKPYPVEYFLTKCDQHMLLVFVDHFGESIEVFRLNDLMEKWEKTNSIGRHAIYISDSACLCIEAKTPEAEDKIFFERLYNKNGKVVFYSLKTRMHHTFNDKNVEESFGDFVGTKHPLYPHAWIEPNWGAIKPLTLLIPGS